MRLYKRNRYSLSFVEQIDDQNTTRRVLVHELFTHHTYLVGVFVRKHEISEHKDKTTVKKTLTLIHTAYIPSPIVKGDEERRIT